MKLMIFSYKVKLDKLCNKVKLRIKSFIGLVNCIKFVIINFLKYESLKNIFKFMIK